MLEGHGFFSGFRSQAALDGFPNLIRRLNTHPVLFDDAAQPLVELFGFRSLDWTLGHRTSSAGKSLLKTGYNPYKFQISLGLVEFHQDV